MTTQPPLPLSLLELARPVSPALKSLDSTPLTGYETLFPWDLFSSKLSLLFGIEKLHIAPKAIAWRSAENILEGLGTAPLAFTVSMAPLTGEAVWILPAQEIGLIANLCLTKEGFSAPPMESALAESFYHFCILEVLQLCGEFLFDTPFESSFAKSAFLPKENALCVDISIFLKGREILGRLCLSPQLRTSWLDWTSEQQNEEALLTRPQAQALVTLHLEIGKVTLPFSNWQQLKEGDCLLLDNCSLKGEELEGKVAITHQGKVVHRAKLKHQKLKILEPPLLHEVDTVMTPYSDDPSQEETDALEQEEPGSIDESLPEMSEELFAEEEFPETEKPLHPSARDPLSSQEGSVSTSQRSTEAPSFISPSRIPLKIAVEIGRVEMTIERLLQLEPGNFLELDLNPQKSVDLTIQGKVVAKGELVRFEEAIAVRITEIGKYE